MFVSDNLGDLYLATKAFLIFTASMYSMDKYHGEPMIQELLYRLKDINNEVEIFREIFEYTLDEDLYTKEFTIPYHNCYSFGNGVESNRIRDNFNLPFIANGVKASTTLSEQYKEEHRKTGLIYSGIYNSMSGVNNLNQFIQAEKITKDELKLKIEKLGII